MRITSWVNFHFSNTQAWVRNSTPPLVSFSWNVDKMSAIFGTKFSVVFHNFVFICVIKFLWEVFVKSCPLMQKLANQTKHYSDVIMNVMASQITSLMIVYSTVYSSADQRKHKSPASLAFVWKIRWWPVNSPHKGPVTRKLFPFDDVIMKIFPQRIMTDIHDMYHKLTLDHNKLKWQSPCMPILCLDHIVVSWYHIDTCLHKADVSQNLAIWWHLMTLFIYYHMPWWPFL